MIYFLYVSRCRFSIDKVKQNRARCCKFNQKHNQNKLVARCLFDYRKCVKKSENFLQIVFVIRRYVGLSNLLTLKLCIYEGVRVDQIVRFNKVMIIMYLFQMLQNLVNIQLKIGISSINISVHLTMNDRPAIFTFDLYGNTNVSESI